MRFIGRLWAWFLAWVREEWHPAPGAPCRLWRGTDPEERTMP